MVHEMVSLSVTFFGIGLIFGSQPLKTMCVLRSYILQTQTAVSLGIPKGIAG